MKPWIASMLLTLVLCFVGCQEESVKQPDGIDYSKVAGTWKSERFNWEFTFNEYGKLLSLVHTMGVRIDVKKGGRTLKGIEGSEGVVVLGPCTTNYDANTRELKISVDIDYFDFKLPNGNLKGLTKDWFEGKLSEDGTKWIANWYSYGELEGAESKPDINNIKPEKVIFTKITNSN